MTRNCLTVNFKTNKNKQTENATEVPSIFETLEQTHKLLN